jgi:phosphoserine phosphatase
MNLVLQGTGIAAADASQVAVLCGARSFEQVAKCAWRLLAPSRSPQGEAAVAAWCEKRSLDHAWVEGGRKLSAFGLLAMDMDSTLITIECIDEIGGMLGIKPAIAAITARAMRGEIDYAESLRQRVGLLQGLGIEALDRVYEEKLRFSPGAEALVKHAQRLGIRTLLVSGGFTFFTDRIQKRLGLDFTLSNVLDIEGGKLTGRVSGTIVDAAGKAEHLKSVAHALGLEMERTIAIGDGANDIPMLEAAGVSIAYRAKPVVRARATYALNHSGLDGVINLFE